MAPEGSSPGRPARRQRRLAGAASVAVLVLVLLVGCSVPSNTPSNYDDATEANFIEGCTATDSQGASVGSGASQAFCECAYNWISATYPYSQDTAQPGYAGLTFSDLDNALGSNPTDIPAEVTQGLSENCDESGSLGVSPATTVPSSTETTAAPTPG